jgi:hypothetical protein
MIPEEYRKFNTFDTSSIEGKLLIAALAALTSIDTKDIKEGRYGGMNHPDTVVDNIWSLANRIYHEDEYKKWEISQNREQKINSIFE